jgi:hypothetical protein
LKVVDDWGAVLLAVDGEDTQAWEELTAEMIAMWRHRATVDKVPVYRRRRTCLKVDTAAVLQQAQAILRAEMVN